MFAVFDDEARYRGERVMILACHARPPARCRRVVVMVLVRSVSWNELP
jgi:hypothetical protein